MILKTLFSILCVAAISYASALKKTYYIDGDDINISTIFPHVKNNDLKLFSIDNKYYTKKIKSKLLIKILDSHGFHNLKANSSYIYFVKNSPVDTSKVKSKLKEFYKQRYKHIKINSIIISPRSYIDSLPKDYAIHIRSRDYLYNKGTLYIKTPKHKEIFFNFIINADVTVYKSKTKIKKATELSNLNTKKTTVKLEKFRALPIQELKNRSLQSKRQILKDRIITQKDIVGLSIVRRGSNVNVQLHKNGIYLEVVAKALKDGKLNDIIPLKTRNKKILNAKVIGENLAEIK